MKRANWFVCILFAAVSAGTAGAQERMWVQIEAQPSLREAEERVRAYSGAFAEVAGFAMSTGWYAIALGPYSPEEAQRQLEALRTERLIPGDSYLADGKRYRRQFWPVGAALNAPEPQVAPPAPETTAALPQSAAPALPTALPDETPREARQSEAALSQGEREQIQTALKWAGFYPSAVDGAFGPGTRRSMADWQIAQGYEETGVLTSRQRAALLESYAAEMAAIGLETRTDTEAGIEMLMPTAMVAFSHYEPPFVHYDEKDGSGVRLILISQQGDQATLSGLYDVMQTLRIVPLNGERERGSNSFFIEGRNSHLNSYTQAALKGGLIKGFTLVWPSSDETRMQKVLAAMKDSFVPVGETALDAGLVPATAEQRADLLSGLEVRKPELSRTGFYVDGSGAVLTTSEVLAQCKRITIDGDHEVEVAATDAGLGLALLKPREPLAPMSYATFQTGTPRLRSEVAVAGYSYGDRLDAPVMTFGALEDIKGLDGEADRARLALGALPGDAGGPVFDTTGSVLGMLLPRETGGARVLPDDVSFATEAGAVAGFLSQSGVTPEASTRDGAMAAEDLTRLALGMTVLVSCWN